MLCQMPSPEHTRAPDSLAMSGANSHAYTGSALPGNVGCRVMRIHGLCTPRQYRVPSLHISQVPQVSPHGAVRPLTSGPDSLLSRGPQTNLCRALRTQVMTGPAYAVTSGPVYSLRMGSALCDCHYISPRTNYFPSDTSLQCTSRRARWREEWSRKTCPWYWCSCLCSTWLLLP